MQTINNNALRSSRDGELQTFFYCGKNVRTITKDGEIWWVLKDICEILGIENSRNVTSRLENDEKATVHITDISHNGTKQNRMITVINEYGLYNVILLSRKPEAKKFQHWATHEVFPHIRRHGAYITTSKLEEFMNDPDTFIKLLSILKEERLAKEKLQNQIEIDRPKILFADAVSASEGTVLIGELAKILRGNGIQIGQNRLYEKLRQDGFLIRRDGSDHNMPTQKSMDLGLFKIKETSIVHSDGHITVSKTTKVTGRGQQYFVTYFLNNRGNHDEIN